MSGNDSHTETDKKGVRRRRFVKAAGATGAVAGLAGCLGGGGDGDGGGGGGGEVETIPDEPPEEEVEITLSTDSNFANSQEEIVSTMRENGGLPDTVKLNWTAGSFESGQRQARYQQLLGAGQESPTIMMMDNGWTIPFIARNQLLNLNQAFPEDLVSSVEDKLLSNMLATAQGQNGDLFGVPLFADFPTIQYRKDLFREAGYSDSDFDTWATEPMKWSDFSEMVAQVRDETGTEMGFNWQGDSYVGLACCDFVEFMGSWGGSYFGAFDNLFGPVGDRPITVDEEQVLNALQMMRTFIHGQEDPEALSEFTQCSPQNVVSFTEEPSRTPFTEGNAVALRNWPYSIVINGAEPSEENDQTGFGEDLGVMPIPFHTSESDSPYGPEIGGSTSALGGWHLTVNPNAPMQKKQAALQVFRALQNDQVRLDLFEIGGWIPPVPDLIDTEETRQLDVIGRYVDSIAVAGQNAVPRPVTAVWPSQSSKVSQQVNASLRQEKSPSQALSDLKGELEALEQQG